MDVDQARTIPTGALVPLRPTPIVESETDQWRVSEPSIKPGVPGNRPTAMVTGPLVATNLENMARLIRPREERRCLSGGLLQVVRVDVVLFRTLVL